jgi:hypothetical protein
MKRAIWLVVGLGWGCTSVEDGGECGRLGAGTYRVTMTEESGDCGGGESLVTLRADGSVVGDDGSCVAMRTYADGCALSIESRCEERTTSGALAGTSVIDGVLMVYSTRAEGTLEMVARDAAGNILCQSIYAVTYERI